MNTMQLLKRRFFAMRNGAIADSLRRQGAPYRIIFGLNIPQIADIAREFGPNEKLSLQLRANTTTRESMLIAPMLYPLEKLTPTIACDWLKEATTTEIIDIACLKLIKHVKDVDIVISTLAADTDPMHKYAAIRLGANILPAYMDTIEEIAKKELKNNDPMTMMACRMILDDIEWRREEEEIEFDKRLL